MTKLTNVCGVYAIKKEGDFCITNYPDKTEFTQFCPKHGTCSIQIDKIPSKHPVWFWNGDYENPSISPSIGCDVLPRCGKHITVTKGVS